MKKLSLVVPFLLAGCATAPVGTPGTGSGSNYTPVIDAPKDELYYKDLRECRQLAYQVQKQQESSATQGALIGALIGGALGAGEDKEAALGGAIAGGALGAGSQVAQASNSGKKIVNNCMRGRGYNVLL